ncbi:hypothetical protein ACS0TY_001948 [Phlomoides rotata]
MLTASAHIITAVIGSGVLSLAWAMAQLGWIAGLVAILGFSVITWFTSMLLADCYRSADGTRNYVYKDAVKSHLGGINVQLCALAQYSNLVGVSIGYSITTAISMVAVKKAHCFHIHGHKANCMTSNNPYIILFGAIQIVLSQIPNFHKLSAISFIAAIMSFAYSTIGIILSIARIASGAHAKTSIGGIPMSDSYTKLDKMWNIFAALGNIAFAYAFSVVLIEIQDTIKSGVPENKVMKNATYIAIGVSTLFYMLCGVLGYAAFGHDAPGNFLTGFGFYDPFWVIQIANLCIAIHLFGAYQVFCQPIFAAVEKRVNEKWGGNKFISSEYRCVCFNLNLFRLIWRSCYVVFTTTLAMIFPFFNDFVGLVGAISFWPLTVFFPVEMYIARKNVRRFSLTWIGLRVLVILYLAISIMSAAGSIRGLAKSLKHFRPFQSKS